MKIGSNGYSLPLDVVTETMAVFGRRGSGKTNTATVLVEELLDAGAQVVVIDPKAEWWGLTSSSSGRSAGYGVTVLGGDRGDLPLDERDGATVADFVVQERMACVLSLRHLESDAAVRRFVTDFAARLYRAKGGQPSPIMVVLEEAHLFVPQHVRNGDAAMVGAIQKLVRQGRAFGVGMMLVDQRPASVNKDVLTQAGILICHQVAGPHDRRALQDWIDAHDSRGHAKEFESSLAGLAQGEAWVWSGERDLFDRVKMRHRKTYDSSATPKLGAKAEGPTKRSIVDLAALRSKLSATIEKARADDPEVLRARIRELEAAVRKAAGFTEADVRATVAARDEEWRNGMKRYADGLREAIDGLVGVGPLGKPPIRTSEVAYLNAPKSPQASATQNLSAGERTVLMAIAQHGERGVTREQLTVLTGYKRSSRDTYLQRLSQRGMVGFETGGNITATSVGRDALGVFTPLPTGPALLAHWLEKLTGGEHTILNAIAKYHGAYIGRDTVSCGYKRSARDTYIQRLCARRLVTSDRGTVALGRDLL